MRALQLLAWIVVLALIITSVVRRRRPMPRPPGIPLDELVKDPVCQMYVVRSRAVPASGAVGPFFCSAECAQRWAQETR